MNDIIRRPFYAEYAWAFDLLIRRPLLEFANRHIATARGLGVVRRVSLAVSCVAERDHAPGQRTRGGTGAGAESAVTTAASASSHFILLRNPVDNRSGRRSVSSGASPVLLTGDGSERARRGGRASWAISGRWQLLNINVSFCRLEADEPRYKKAKELYEAEVPEMLGQLRAEISAARRLVSPAMHERLKTYYCDTLLRVDAQLESLIRRNETATRSEWRAQHEHSFHDAQDQLEKVLGELAVELDLTAPRAIVT